MSSSRGSRGGVRNPNTEDLGNIDEREAAAAPTDRIWHLDHWDGTDGTEDPEDSEDDDFDWLSDYITGPDDSIANDKLYNQECTQEWLQKLSCLRRVDIPDLVKGRHPPKCRIPLFADEDGAEYQVSISMSTSLTHVTCPLVFDFSQIPTNHLYQLRSRRLLEGELSNPECLEIPRTALHLGILEVVTTARFPKYFHDERRRTERTDYDVVIDVDAEEMPVWILAPRRQLRQRAASRNYAEPIPPLPIFRGLMLDHGSQDDNVCDTACILPSVHQLGPRKRIIWKQPSFEAACDLVRKTRAIIDAVAVVFPMDILETFHEDGQPTSVDQSRASMTKAIDQGDEKG